MASIPSEAITPWDDVILALAKKRSRINGVEIDDLIQEGRMNVLLCLLGGADPSEVRIKNAMRRWINSVKKQSHVTYELINETM